MKLVCVQKDVASGVCSSHQTPLEVTGVAVSTCPTIQASGLPIIREGNIVTFSCGHTGICKSSSTIKINGLAPMLSGDQILPLSGAVTATLTSTNNTVVFSE